MSLCDVYGYGPPPPSCIGYLEDSATWDTTYNPHGRFANLLLDDWFKRAFGSKDSKRLLELLLQELIPERKIKGLEYVSQEHINLFPGRKDIRVDVECVDAEGARFMVELQVAPQNWFSERALYYSCFSVINQMQKGVDEYVFPPVYFIGLLDFSWHQNSDRVLYRYALKELVSGELMTDKLNFIFLELPNCKKALTKKASLLDNFCYVMHNMKLFADKPEGINDEELFNLLFESADFRKFTPEEKAKYRLDMTTDRDRRNQLKKATEDGIRDGRAEGRAEGREEEKVAIAKNLLAMKMPVSDISKATGLPEEEINNYSR